MKAFFSRFWETAQKETRGVILLKPHGSLPAGKYSYLEFYCDDLQCNCQRVTLRVHADTDEELRHPLAQIGFGWGSLAFYKQWLRDDALAEEAVGVSLSGPPDDDNARFFMDIIANDLTNNPDLAERYKRHYTQFREAARKENKTKLPKSKKR